MSKLSNDPPEEYLRSSRITKLKLGMVYKKFTDLQSKKNWSLFFFNKKCQLAKKQYYFC